MDITSNRSRAVAALALLISGCASEPEERSREAKGAGEAREIAPHASVVLGWGDGPSEVGFRPKAKEIGAEGPSSVVARGGSAFVLDRLNERVIEVPFDGATRVIAGVPRDAEHLAASVDGSVAVWSPLRARVWMFARDGEALGEVAVPRALRDLRSIAIGPSRRVSASTTMQETLDLGSPNAPLDLASTLRTKREGAAFLADGRGVAVRVDHGSAELVVYGAREREAKAGVAARHRVEGAIDAAQIAGAVGSVVCMRAERVSAHGGAIAVAREAVCVDATSGAVVLRAALPRPGESTPHEELAVGDDPPVLVAMTPQRDGLVVQRWSLRAEVSR